MQVFVERVGPAGAEVRADAVDREVQPGEPPGGLVQFLAVDADIERPPAVGLNEPLRLDEHAAGTAAGVIDPAARSGLQHLDEQPDHALRSVVLAAASCPPLRRTAQAVLVDMPEHVTGLARLLAEADLRRSGRRARRAAVHLPRAD